MADEEPVEEEEVKKPKPMLVFIVAMVLVSIVAVAGGWVVGTILIPPPSAMEEKMADEKSAEKMKEEEAAEVKEGEQISSDANEVVELDSILVALNGDSRVWVRMNLAVIGPEDADLGIPEVKTRITNDITSLVKTLTLAQISGPSGFIHLKEDLLDRAKLTTDGQVEDLLIMSIVAE